MPACTSLPTLYIDESGSRWLLSNGAPAGGDAGSGFVSKLTATNLVKYLVIGMIAVLSVRIIPYIGAASPAPFRSPTLR